ncbi:MAG: hypothetical protein JSV62_06665 [Promethearchaeota archaeon]|nr:MAG: hypothetical protein JSV62_06665 [Candidatus Lokiarchaeota archaeon]
MDLSTGKPIEITHKSLFDEYFQKYPPESSEFTFTNLFMWRNYYNFLFLEYKEHLILFSNDYLKNRREPINIDSQDYFYFFPPIGPHPENIIIELFENLGNIEVHRVPEDICVNLKTNVGFSKLNLECLDDLNNWDYVYNREEILNLTGNKYRQNRRWLHKFLENYNYDFKLLTGNLVEK